MFAINDKYEIRQPTSQYFAARMITQQWAQPVDAKHTMFPAGSDVKDPAGNTLVTAYALKRPDGQWSLLVINKDYDHPHRVRIAFRSESAQAEREFSGPVTVITFGKAQYQWHPDRKQGYADPDGPPVESTVQGGAHALYTLPAVSLNVVRGRISPQ